MFPAAHLTGKVNYVGVNDRKTHLFENMWPLPHGVSYNAYLIDDEKTALIDTVEIGQLNHFLKKIDSVIGNKPIDYLIVNHMEPDHAGSLAQILLRYPNITVVGNKKTFGMIEGYFGIVPKKLEVAEGHTLNLGHHKLTFYMAPMVHWPEVMVSYDATEKILFSADAFGTFGTLDGGVKDTELDLDKYWSEMRRYYSNIVGKYGSPVQAALKKLSALEINMICSLHGPVWTQDIDKVVALYDQWSRYEAEEGAVVVYGSMYGHTEEMAEVVARGLSDNGIKNIVIHDVSNSHESYILSDIFRYKALITGSPTYSNELYPGIQNLLHKLETRGVRGRLFGYFGSYTWAGATLRHFESFAERMKWEVIGSPVEEKMALKADATQALLELGKAMAERLKQTE